MRLLYISALLTAIAGCSSPPPSISYTTTIVERRQDSVWVLTKPGGRSFYAQPGVDVIDAKVYSLPELKFLSEVRIRTTDGVIPETRVYQIPPGERQGYRVYLVPIGQSGGPNFDVPMEQAIQ